MVPVKPRELLEHPNVKSRAISSQATQECVEGSTTRSWSPERTVEAHERAAVRICSKCLMEKHDFHKGAVWCKTCVSEYCKAIYSRKREEILVQKRQYREANKARRAEFMRAWQSRNVDKVRQYQREYRKSYYANPEKRAIRNLDAATRRFAQRQATPKWADKKAMRAIYLQAQQLSSETGKDFVVDHIYPLMGRTVCGLHTEQNLQIILAVENSRKNNKLIDEIV